jgi:hypothetical protein
MGKSRTLANTVSAGALLTNGQIDTTKNQLIVQPARPWGQA